MTVKRDVEFINSCYKILEILISNNESVKNTITYQLMEETFAELKGELGPKQFDDLMTGKTKWSDL